MAILTIDYSSACLRRRTSFTAVLPVDSLLPDYTGYKMKERKTFKTLVLMHGYSGDCTDWLTHSSVKNWATKYNCAVLMPSGENSFYLDQDFGHFSYGELVGNEILEVGRKLFPLSDKREDTFIAGLSMGGFGALRNGLKYRQNFSHIASFSGGFATFEEPQKPDAAFSYDWYVSGGVEKKKNTDDNPRFILEELKKEGKLNEVPKIWISCGSEDGLYGVNVKYRDYLKSLGLDVTWDELPLTHDWPFWSDQLEKIGSWLPLNNDGRDGISTL